MVPEKTEIEIPPPRVNEIARKTKISPSHISKIFSGKRTPSLGHAALIASAMKLSLDELYVMLVTIQDRAGS